MSNKMLQAYFIGLSEAALQYHSQFAVNHPGFESVVCLFLAEVQINGEKLFGSLDNGDKQQALEFCRKFISTYEDAE